MQIAILGSAGSGKTLITARFGEFLEKEGYTVKRSNLDPGVLSLPYEPDFDVRDYFTLEEIMRKENLGPNGAILEAMDRLSKLKLPSYNADYVLIDTPGQLEVFAFRDSGPAIFKGMKDFYGCKGCCPSFFRHFSDNKHSGFVNMIAVYNGSKIN